MNKPNPLVPQGTFADKGRSHVRLTVFAILAVHLVLLGVLLIAGCNKGGDQSAVDPNAINPPSPPPVPTDLPPVTTPTHPPDTGLAGTPPPGITPPPTIVETPPPPPPPPPAPEYIEHTIVQGDSFYTLGKKYGVGFKAIGDANPGVDSTRLKIGQKIKIPPPKPAGAATNAGTLTEGGAPSATGEIVHTVKSGDNLWTLARRYGVKESAIRSANNLRTSQLKVGQKLKIPSKTPPPVEAPPPVDPSLGQPPAGGGLLLTPQP